MMYVRSKRGAVSQGVSHFMGSLSWFLKSQHLLLAYYCKMNGRDAFDVCMSLNEGSLLEREDWLVG